MDYRKKIEDSFNTDFFVNRKKDGFYKKYFQLILEKSIKITTSRYDLHNNKDIYNEKFLNIIAKNIVIIDTSIHDMYRSSLNYLAYFISKEYMSAAYDIISSSNFNYSISNEDLYFMRKIEPQYKENFLELKSILDNFNISSLENQKKLITLLTTICEYNTSEDHFCTKQNNLWENNLAINCAALLCSVYYQKKFVYQTSNSFEIYLQYSKEKMYYYYYESTSKSNVSSKLNSSNLSILMNIFNLNTNSIEGNNISSNVIEQITKSLDCSQKISNTLISLMDNLASSYDNHVHLLDNFKEQFMELKLNNEILLKKNTQLEHQIKKNTIDNRKEYSFLDSKLSKLELENANLKEAQKELVALREYLFIKEHLNEEDIVTDDILNTNRMYNNVVVIGGHVKWRNKLATILPEATILSTDKNVIDKHLFFSKKLVAFNVQYLSHSFYLKVMQYCSGKEILFLTKTNLNHCKQEIDSKLRRMID